MHAVAGRLIGVSRIQWQVALVDAIEPPRRRRPDVEGEGHRVLLDPAHRGLLAQLQRPACRQADREAFQRVPVDVSHLAAVPLRQFFSDRLGVGVPIVQDDHVAVRDRMLLLSEPGLVRVLEMGGANHGGVCRTCSG